MTTYNNNFLFNNLSRIGDDNCTQDINSIQNTSSCNYILQNYYVSDCKMTQALKLATSQPCINYSGAYGSDPCGTNIDVSSQLSIGTLQTHPKCHIDLFQRPFATVPYLGKGSVCPILESQIQQGELGSNKRSINKLTEQSYIPYNNTPLIPNLKNNIQNPKNIIENVANQNWIRGGLPSRELTKDNTYYTSS